jgi:hypothetical protein
MFAKTSPKLFYFLGASYVGVGVTTAAPIGCHLLVGMVASVVQRLQRESFFTTEQWSLTLSGYTCRYIYIHVLTLLQFPAATFYWSEFALGSVRYLSVRPWCQRPSTDPEQLATARFPTCAASRRLQWKLHL